MQVQRVYLWVLPWGAGDTGLPSIPSLRLTFNFFFLPKLRYLFSYFFVLKFGEGKMGTSFLPAFFNVSFQTGTLISHLIFLALVRIVWTAGQLGLFVGRDSQRILAAMSLCHFYEYYFFCHLKMLLMN
jgi:hypothetical protein